MPISSSLRRLLRIRDLQEEQSKLALESALGELNRLETTLAASAERGSQGRRLIIASAERGELPERISGIEETRTADRFKDALATRITAKNQAVVTLRQQYLDRRVERRQAETLVEAEKRQEILESERRSQHMLDDWFSARLHRQGLETELDQDKRKKNVSGRGAQPRSTTVSKNT